MLHLPRTDRGLRRAAGHPAETADKAPAPRQRKRRGATAMEYLVVASFIFAAIVVAIQHFGAAVGSSMKDSAEKIPSATKSKK